MGPHATREGRGSEYSDIGPSHPESQNPLSILHIGPSIPGPNARVSTAPNPRVCRYTRAPACRGYSGIQARIHPSNGDSRQRRVIRLYCRECRVSRWRGLSALYSSNMRISGAWYLGPILFVYVYLGDCVARILGPFLEALYADAARCLGGGNITEVEVFIYY